MPHFTDQFRPRKDLSALEDRLKDMEEMLRRSQQTLESTNMREPTPPLVVDISSIDDSASSRGSPQETQPLEQELATGTKEDYIRLAKGFLASCNHLFPIFNPRVVLERMNQEWPPSKKGDLVWWTTLMVVLGYAHRLRAMSDPSGADFDNREACRYLSEALDVAPMLSYVKPSLESAQVLVGVASILRGTAMPQPSRMFISSAVRILQDMDAHKEEEPSSQYFDAKAERARVFWVAYSCDKAVALQTGKPPVLYEQDISRMPPTITNTNGLGVVKSLDRTAEANFFVACYGLSYIEGQLWERMQSATPRSTAEIMLARSDLNELLAAWKADLAFAFKPDELVGRWPKHCILYIIMMHFQYFQALVEVNRDQDPMWSGTCSAADYLKSYPHSTDPLVVQAARDSLDLANLAPRGNFQHVWLFFDYNISAVLTLLLNYVVRPLEDQFLSADRRRVEDWMQVIELLANTSERPDLLEKRDFLLGMKAWSLEAVQIARASAGPWYNECLPLPVNDQADWSDFHPDVFPLDQWDWTQEHDTMLPMWRW
jgi:hypothetical protein